MTPTWLNGVYQHPATTPPPPPLPQNEKRPLAAAAAAAGPKTAHVIKIRDFEPMAAHIASCSAAASEITIPRSFCRALDRVISIRSTFVERLTSAGVEVSATSDNGHAFFVDVPASSPARAKVLRGAGLWDEDPIWAGRAAGVAAGMLPRVRARAQVQVPAA
ncbi:hypothetical protein ISF_07335 [Cordyceps fumosorosea ARSEF 2679]|uniref:DUF6604 domain-containing protein n=1 Tax=Cordyceps fumosorosea (strain ARSEF 2679) TaxID=1081104 RepID=A0A167PMH7_CORFA|nr:hypothetical protein ISF_07335 [Cordyceps fumosorosea ARSEF 2679]OAA56819.1 hypothetical protein ISF_07335 [Cordyceps fumosorosea ARSEF 2679]